MCIKCAVAGQRCSLSEGAKGSRAAKKESPWTVDHINRLNLNLATLANTSSAILTQLTQLGETATYVHEELRMQRVMEWVRDNVGPETEITREVMERAYNACEDRHGWVSPDDSYCILWQGTALSHSNRDHGHSNS